MKFILDHFWLVALALVSGGMLLWSMLRRSYEVTPTEAVMLINHAQALVLDVREAAEFAAGHIADAHHIPLSQLKARLPELQKWKDKPIVINCQAGRRSAQACAVLRKHGFSQAHSLAGGIAAWQAAKLPLVKG
ncbi:MAG: rhodanese-like domain-containing protein [Methylophilaceae bacterium]|nr:rhodanese-like domain-containing protein [Methylophilaceae bacterium]